MKKLLIILTICCLAVVARAENVVSVSTASGHPLDEVVLQVSLTNDDAATAFQAEIPLGSQLTYVAGSVALNAARVTDHQVTVAVVNGTLKIFAYSLTLSPFVGNEGNLLSFSLRLKNEPGDYTLDMGSTKLSDASGNALPMTTHNGTVTILSPKLGINTTSIDYGHVPIRSEYTQTASVTNVGNEPLTITGITFSDAVFSCPGLAETTLQAGENANFTFRFAPTVKGAVTANATIVSNSVSGNGTIQLMADPFAVNEIHIGTTTGYCDSIVELPISMNNMESIIGFQIEANLNPALEFVDFTLSDRKADHVATGVVSGTTLRLMAYSPSGAAFVGDDGVVGTVRFRLHGLYGNYYLNPSKAVLADVMGEDVLSQKYQGYVTVRSPRIIGNSVLYFGSSSVTETVTQEYLVNNNGDASMRIDQVIFDQEGFLVAESLPLTVAQYANTTLHVSYNREQAGQFDALMKIYSNDPQNGLKNVVLSGNRYEPNSLDISADPFSLGNDEVAVALALHNYTDIVALQADFTYPYHDFSVSPADFRLTERFANHSLYATALNDSTYRILVLSMQNGAVDGQEGVVLNATLHPRSTPMEDEYMVSVSNIVLSDRAGDNRFSGADVSTTFALTMTQAVQLAQGWNWWSTYIEQDGIDGLGMLQESLGIHGLAIKSQNDFTTNYYESLGYNYWYGGLETLSNEQGYMINTNSPLVLGLTGRRAKCSNHPIAIHPDWNWIGYPVNQEQLLVSAMSGFLPENNDVMKDQSGFATYYAGYGWYPEDFIVSPGKGYMYNSNASIDKTLAYSVNRESPLVERCPDVCRWTTDVHKYADNMSVIAVVNWGEKELREPIEVGAFVDGVCRGSAMLRYFEPTGRYYVLLSITGEDGDKVSFALSDAESDLFLTFHKNDVVGSLDAPLIIPFGTGANVKTNVPLYPNPVDCYQEFTIAIPESEQLSETIVTNMLGEAVSRYSTNAENSKMILYEPGIFVVKAICKSGNVYQSKIVVK